MTEDSATALSAALGASPPASFARLDAAQQRALADAFTAERAAQNDGLEQAAEEALKLVPAVARGPVRRILFK
ncbi:hypothetical protein G5C51_26510 [Streptomyces sp. A7024]|uniref:Uncharacterized protein n=1 Tax=Streptomyces coryli TaxID=1128680 RepID=A0A6G4U5D4_9ACTN|nr:hypothetical protein [Streptomyces coryli]NGN67445.1 hypothetical protein [Streptomyces coryli]